MNRANLWRKTLATLIASSMLFTQAIPTARAAATDLGDVPMAVKSRVHPNIMFVLDNSGSMAWTYMPDIVQSFSSKSAYRSSSFNRVYYNPNVTYTVPVDSTGTSLGNSPFTAAWKNGFNHGAGTVNLSNSFQAYISGGSGSDTPQAAYYCTYNGGANVILRSPADNTILNNNSNFTCQTVPAAQQQNFANWYSYYRTRILAMKSGLSLAFAGLNDRYRVGFSTINDNSGNDNTSGANFLDISDFTAAQKSSWFTTLFSISPNGSTPLQEALDRVGQYYQSGAFPGASSHDPITDSCQPNYVILSTDGYWNGSFSGVGNQDQGPIPTIPEPTAVDTNHPDPISGTALVGGSATWPRPFYDGPSTGCTISSTYTTTGSSFSCNRASDTLADVAMKYWVTDLRSSMANNVTANSADPATWQHMVTFTIGMGVDGILPFNATTLSNLKSGTIGGWPTPGSNSQANIDDLWHAAVNGHGQYFSAGDPAALQAGLINTLSDIVGRAGAAAAVTVSNPNVTATDNSSFASKYNSGNWSGDLAAYPIDLNTGLPNTNAPIWPSTAQVQLDNLTWTSRKIGTYNGTSGVAFTWAGIGSTLQATLNTPYANPGTSDGSSVLNFLRGDRSLEGSSYRIRTHVLGDIINAEAVFVGAPRFNYADNGYAAYKTAQASRTTMIYQPANDGLVHAFTAASGGGAEAWAYLPGALFNMRLTAYPSTSSLVNLSFRNGFTHLYYVDATPTTWDLDLSYTSSYNLNNPPAPAWRTVVVGGLGKGGRGYYALDVTNPAANSDTDVANKVLWEFPNNATTTANRQNIGYTFGKPIIVKTVAAGWVALVTSGYNNGSDTGGTGQGYLFVLDARTGSLLKAISTGVGSSTSPSGLAYISAYVQNGDVDSTTDFVYGGDLLGNVWRFDLSGNSINSWGVTKLATLVDSGGNPQPITTAPELTELAGLAKRVIYVGTGQYLGDTDVPGATGANSHATQTQSIYGLVDDLTNNPLISPLRSNLQQQTVVVSGTTASVSGTSVNYNTQKGWYLDLPNDSTTTPSTQGQRVTGDPQLAMGQLVVTTNVPNSDPCTPGGSSWIYSLDYAFSTSVPGSQLSASGQSLGATLASRPTLIMLPSGVVKALTRQSDASTTAQSIGGGGGVSSKKRVTWREIIEQ